MTTSFFKIPGLSDTELKELEKKIDQDISEKESQGVYQKFNLDNLSTFDIQDIQSESQFLDYYLKVVQKTWAIDINDFEIPGRSGFAGKIEKGLKKVIWKLLKFYTYRLFSQQREFNSQVAATLQTLQVDFDEKFERLESQISQLSSKNNVV